MMTKIKMWGNSFGVRIPKPIAQELNLHAGVEVKVVAKKNMITIVPIPRSKHRLEELISLITEKNLHREALNDNPVGSETW